MSLETDLDPRTRRAQLLTTLEDTHREVREACSQASPEAFFHQPEKGWSGAEHLAHLVTSVNAVAKGLTMNRLLLRILFGRSRGGSRSFVTVREDYRALLAAGGRASGRYVPRPQESPTSEAQAGKARDALLGRWQRACDRLLRGFEDWDDDALDHYRLPHPLLGKLTVREMLLFTAYHNQHHAQTLRKLR